MNIKNNETLEAFGELIPKLSEREQERLLAYAEGMAFMVNRREQEAVESAEEKCPA